MERDTFYCVVPKFPAGQSMKLDYCCTEYTLKPLGYFHSSFISCFIFCSFIHDKLLSNLCCDHLQCCIFQNVFFTFSDNSKYIC